MRLQVLDETVRFECGSCTACCDQPWLTLIEEEKAHALDLHDFSRHPQLADKEFYTKLRDGSDGYYALAKGEGTRCLFLDHDGLCIIHKEMGPEAKPHMCRQFPYLPARGLIDDRVSANYGCPAVQEAIGPTLPDQAEGVSAVVGTTEQPPVTDATVSLDDLWQLTQPENDALHERILSHFEPGSHTDLWTRFAEVLGLLSGVAEFKQAASLNGTPTADLVERLRSGQPLEGSPEIPEIRTYRNLSAAPLGVRFLFAATLYRDAVPASATMKLSFFQRLTLVPKLMALSRLSGGYASRLLERNINIDDVLAHPISDELEDNATQLLVRYFRSRLWQRMLTGTQLNVVGGVHQHIQDLNVILFLARAEAQRVDAPRLGEALIRQALTRVEFHLANQKRLYAFTLEGWLRARLGDPGLALQSLRLMSLKGAPEPVNA